MIISTFLFFEKFKWDLPDRVCWCVAQGHALLSSGCLGDRWLSIGGCQQVRSRFVCAVWYEECQCASQTCGTKRTHTGQSPGSWPRDSRAEPLLSLEDPLLMCRWNSLIHLLNEWTLFTDKEKQVKYNLWHKDIVFFLFFFLWFCSSTHLCGPCWDQYWELECHWTGSATSSLCPLTSSCRRTDHWPSQSRRQTTEKLQVFRRQVKLVRENLSLLQKKKC